MAARVNIHTHTHTEEIGSGRFVGCQSATSTCKSIPYMRVQMKFKLKELYFIYLFILQMFKDVI